jgi:prolyl-tRNA editing enzyme YbaK/EbsC (Cys-tRNA(Pro) deacylase)
MKTIPLLTAGMVLAAAPAFAQHAVQAQGAAAPYAGLQSRDIKALSPEDTEQLVQGNGMSLALAAELNGYPGPAHVLEMSDALHLNARQREQSETLMARHKAQARALGAQLVSAERELDRAFAGGTISAADVTRMTARIGDLQAALRASHLQAHLAETALLAPQQVARYQELRGYANGGAAPVPAAAHLPAHAGHQ